MMQRAVIFDFDGTIVNTEVAMFEFFREEMAGQNIYLKDGDIKFKIGRTTTQFLESIRDEYKLQSLDIKGLVKKRRGAFLADIPKYSKPFDGVRDVIASLKNAGFSLAICSGSQKDIIQKTLEYYGLYKFFDFISSITDFDYKKPDPGLYVKCLEGLGVSNDHAIAVEDSATGILSAKNAGIKVVAISRDGKPMENADFVVNSVREITPDFVNNAFEDRI